MTIEDKHIILKIRECPEQGFRLLLGTYREAVYWHIRRLVVSHEDAQDATQETFVRIFRNFNKYQEQSSFKAWIFRIATNEALRLIESRKKDSVPIDADVSHANLVKSDSYVDFSNLEAVRLQEAILSLPTKQQLAFNLRYYDELSYADIAEATDSTEAAVKMNYHLAKEKIVKLLKER